MRTSLLGLTVPLLLLASAFVSVAPQAIAQDVTLYEVSGRVVSDTGEPLAGANVNGYTSSDDPNVRKMSPDYQNANTETDADGRFTLQLPAGKGYLNVWYDEWRLGDGREIVVEENLTGVTFTLKTPPPRTAIITGTVLDENGQPLEGAQVQLQYGCCYIMPAVTVAEPAPDAPVSSGGNESGAGSSGSAGATEPSTRSMMIAPPQYDDYQTTTTDADGAFSFKAYAGPRQVTAWAKGYAQTNVQVEAKDGETTDVEIQLEKVPGRTAVLEGTVVDAKTGLPISGAHVSARSLEWGRYAEAQTGEDGSYRIETVPGWTEISVNYWPQYGEPMPLAAEGDAVSSDAMLVRPVPTDVQYYPLSKLVKLVDGETDHDALLVPKDLPTIALVGYVVDPDAKKGVEGATVNVWNHETGDWGEAKTDATGSFKILVRAGHYSGNAYKEGYLSGSQSFVVTDDAANRVDLLLPKGESRWAPCEDADCGPIIMYSKGAEAQSMDGSSVAGSETPPGLPDAARSTLAAQDSDEAAATTGGPDKSRTATFSGSGGGLPPYDPDAASGVNAADRPVPSEVPAIGVLALLGIAVLGALAMRRRR